MNLFKKMFSKKYSLDEVKNIVEMTINKSNLDPTFFFSNISGGTITSDDIEKEPYKYHPWIYACSQAILKNVSKLPIVAYRESNPDEIIKDHPVIDILNRPNPLMTKTTLIQSIILNLFLVTTQRGKSDKGGQSFMIPLSGMGQNVNLQRGDIPDVFLSLNDSHIEPVVAKGAFNTLLGWKYVNTENQSHKIFDPGELIRIYNYNPYNILEGLANQHPVQLALLQDIKSDVYNTKLFDNNAIPAGVLSSEMQLGPDQQKTNMDWWNQTYGGAGNNSKIAILSKGLKYQHIGLTAADMQYSDMKKFVKEQKIAVWQLNKIALGQYEDVNHATIIEGRKMLWQDTYFPTMMTIMEAINVQWVRFVDKDLRVKFDTSEVEALKKRYTEEAKNGGIMVKSMRIAPATAARINGIPLTEEDINEQPWLKEDPWKIQQFGAPEEKKKVDNIEKIFQNKTVLKEIEEDPEKFWRGYVEKVLDPGEKSMKSTFVKFFNRQRNDMQDKVDAWLKKNKDKTVSEIARVLNDYLYPVNSIFEIKIDPKVDDFLIDKILEDKRIEEVYKPHVKPQMERASAQLLKELGELSNWSVTDSFVNDFVKDRRAQLRSINTTTFNAAREKIADAITVAIDENMTPQEAAKEIKKALSKVGEIRKNQSKTIARTEIGTITSSTRTAAMKKEGIEKTEWVTAGDEDVRDGTKGHPNWDHMSENGNTAKIGKPFPVTGLRFPLDPNGEAGNIINCRCVTVAVAED